MPEFFQTMMGRRFYDSDFPELVRQLKRLNDNLEKPLPGFEGIIPSMKDKPVQSHSDQMIDVMNDEKQAAEFIASVLPGATVVKKEPPEGMLTYLEMKKVCRESGKVMDASGIDEGGPSYFWKEINGIFYPHMRTPPFEPYDAEVSGHYDELRLPWLTNRLY